MQETEFFEKVKGDYKGTKRGHYVRRDGAEGLGKHAEYLEWDALHNDVEAYNEGKKHIGSYDPETLELYKPPAPGRKIYI